MFHVLGLLFWLVVIPFCIGLIPAGFLPEEKRRPGVVLLAGYFLMWSLFEAAAIPAVLWVKYENFKTASACFMIVSIVCAAAGLWTAVRREKTKRAVPSLSGVKARLGLLSPAERIEWAVFFVLLGVQLYMAAAYTSFDGDDAFYVVESLIAQQADVMYRILPYTGRSTTLDIRHALAAFPMWVAYAAVKSDIHATVMSHLVMPFVLIPLSYLVYYEIGRVLFVRSREPAGGTDTVFYRENLPIFMIIMAFFQIFGNVSIYTNETFFLTRTWQGKAAAGSIVIPALLWAVLEIYEGEKTRRRDPGSWMLLVCVNMTAGLCSSIAVFLVSMLMAVTALCLAAVERDLKILFKMAAACIPNMIYMAIYAVWSYSHPLI